MKPLFTADLDLQGDSAIESYRDWEITLIPLGSLISKHLPSFVNSTD